MRSTSLLIPVALILLGVVEAVPRGLFARQQIGTKSVRLDFKGCSASQKKQAQDGWADAITIAKNVKKIDFNDNAANDYFGPAALNRDHQGEIQAVFNHLTTFPQGYFFQYKWVVNVRCGDALDQQDQKQCHPGVAAYEWNTKDQNGSGGRKDDEASTANIHLCDQFFNYKGLKDSIDSVKAHIKDIQKYNVHKYVNTGHIILHEFMHAGVMAYKENGNRPIIDMAIEFYVYKSVDGKRKFRKSLATADVYGPLNCKILARSTSLVDESGISVRTSDKVTINADNFAYYALSKYVQSQIDDYPWLPLANAEAVAVKPKSSALVFLDGPDMGVNFDVYNQELIDAGLTATFHDGAVALLSENGEEQRPIAKGLQWIDDAKYPSAYIANLKLWVEKVEASRNSASGTGPTQAPVPAGPKISQTCIGIDNNKYLASTTLDGNIRDFCAQAAKQGVQDPGSAALFRKFNIGTPEEVSMAMDWPSGLPFKLSEDDCKKFMGQISGGCDGNNPKNPMNWKHGGTVTVDQVKYRVDPVAPRQAPPTTPGGGCDVSYSPFYDHFTIHGNGYASSDYGQSSGGLLERLRNCGVVSDWTFNYGLGDDGREWSAEGKLPIWTKNCVGDSIRVAGGPSGGCSGGG